MRDALRLIFILLLQASICGICWASGSDAEFPAPERMVVVGDIHGDYDRMLEVLQLGGVTDGRGRWIGGKTHLVQLGDLPDRGEETDKVIHFLQKLEKSASRKGGKVHILIGNHDAMNIYGDLRYVTEGEFKAFADRDSVKRLEQLYEDEIKWIKENVPEQQWPVFDDAYRDRWFKKRPPGFLEHRLNWLPDGDIGKWVLAHKAVIKIGSCLFVHAGIGLEYATWTIDRINQEVRAGLLQVDAVEGTILRDEQGPLWYRGLALHPEIEESPLLDQLLVNFQAEHIILGHTVTKGVILPRFAGKVILADVGLSRYYGDNLACLIIENNRFYAVYRGGRLELPIGLGEAGVLAYLKEVEKLEPGNTSIQKRIMAIESRGQAVQESLVEQDAM